MSGDFLDRDELEACGFAGLGERVQISRHALLLAPERIRFGSDVRVDAFCTLSAGYDGLSIGSRVHISAYTSILGRGAAVIEDFCTVSVRCSIFTSNDDYSGATLANPTVPDELRGATTAPVFLREHAILGAGCIVLPGVTIGPGAAVGALTLVKEDVPELAIVAGVPMRRLGTRRSDHRALAQRLPET